MTDTIRVDPAFISDLVTRCRRLARDLEAGTSGAGLQIPSRGRNDPGNPQLVKAHNTLMGDWQKTRSNLVAQINEVADVLDAIVESFVETDAGMASAMDCCQDTTTTSGGC